RGELAAVDGSGIEPGSPFVELQPRAGVMPEENVGRALVARPPQNLPPFLHRLAFRADVAHRQESGSGLLCARHTGAEPRVDDERLVVGKLQKKRKRAQELPIVVLQELRRLPVRSFGGGPLRTPVLEADEPLLVVAANGARADPTEV